MAVTRRQFMKVSAAGLAASSVGALGFMGAGEGLAAGVRPFRLEKATETRNTCPYCAVACGVLIYSSADGTKDGYELKLTRAIVDAVSIPVIASGGAGEPRHMLEAVTKGGASAALIASIVHYGQYSIRQCKEYMAEQGAKVRTTW